MEYSKPVIFRHNVKHQQEAMEEEERRARRRRQRQSVVGCCKKMMAFLFSHIGLAGMVVAYSIMGGFLFKWLEAPYEATEKLAILGRKEDEIQKIYSLAMLVKSDKIDKDNFTMVLREIFLDFQELVTVAVKDKGWDGKDTTDETALQWSFAGALLYAVTVITTIGYGHVAPKTHAGRIVTILYALVGIPLTFLYLSNIGNFLADSFRLFYKKICCDLCCCQKCERKRKRERLRLRRRRELAAQRNEAMRLAVVAETQFNDDNGYYGDLVGVSDENLVMDEDYDAEGQNEANRAKSEELDSGKYTANHNPAYTDGGCEDGGCPQRKDSAPLSTPSTVASAGGANASFFPDPDLDIRETDILDDDTGNDTDGSEMRKSESFIRKFKDAKETKIGDSEDDSETDHRKHPNEKCSKKKDKKKKKSKRFFFRKNKKKKDLVAEDGDNISIHSQDTIVIGGTNLDGEESIKTVDYETVTEASPALEPKQNHEEEEPRKKGRYQKRPGSKKSTHRAVYGKQQSQKSSSSDEPNKLGNGGDGHRSLHVSEESFVTAAGDSTSNVEDHAEATSSVTTEPVSPSSGEKRLLSPGQRNMYPPYGGIGVDTVAINMGDNTYDIEMLDPGHLGKDGPLGFIEDPFDYDDEDEDDEHVTVPISICLILITGYIFGGAMLFTLWEDWDYLTGSYFCFITLSTIGFGDIVPGTDMKEWASHEKLVLCALWLAFGLSLLAMCFNLMQEEVKDKSKWLGKKLGLLRDDDEG